MIRLGDTVTRDFTTHHPITGEITDADTLPTCEIFEDTTDTPILTLTATKRVGKTGNYKTTFVVSVANGFEVNKSYNVVANATVNSITGKARILAFNLKQPAAARFEI